MIELQLSPFAKARVWLSELPVIDTSYKTILRRTTQSHSSKIKGTRTAGLELYIPVGATIRYALLAGKFAPAESEFLSIEMPISDAKGDLVKWALASNVDEVRAGLTDEYIDGILQGISNVADMLGGGTLMLGPAAHGVIGSSSDMFTLVGEGLVNILSANPQSLSEEVITGMLKKIISIP